MILLPLPKMVKEMEGSLMLGGNTMIVMGFSCPVGAYVYADMLKEELSRWAGLHIPVSRGKAKKGDIVFKLDTALGKDRYRLTIDEEGVGLTGGSLNALGWSVQTLRQIVRQSAGLLPYIAIWDEPDLKNRGFYHDVTRGRIQTMENLKKLADTMAFYKMTELQLYVEHTYLFRDIPELWRHETPLTAEEILELDQYCYERGIELVPSLASFGHLCNLLSTRTYADLCELPDSVGKPFSFFGRMEHHTINVSDPRSMELIKQLIGEYMQLFRTNKFNICADETFDLGNGRSKALAEEKGKGNLYVEFISGLFDFLIQNGKQPMFWGDIICGYPALLKKLPKNIICLNWGYGEEQRDTETRILHDAGATQYICPGTRGWNNWVNDIYNGYRNITRMCGFGRKYGAIGVLNTDWGDFGHINHPVFSIPGLIYGAVFSWGDADLDFEELNRQISILEFGDPTGQLVGLLSRINQETVFSWHNVVSFKEWTQRGKVQDEILARFRQEDMSRVPAANERLDGLEEDLRRLSRGMDSGSRGIVAVAHSAMLAIRTWNEVGWYLSGIYSGMLYLESEKNGMELAADLENCLRFYQEIWRENSKEGDLPRISDVFYWYADLLRDDYRKIHGMKQQI